MVFRHVRTDDPHYPQNESRARLLERLLVRHAAEGFDVVELRRQMGKSGYVPTHHRWEDDGHGENLTDEEGRVLLVGGMPPADLAAELIDTARQHVDETGERKNYRLVALRHAVGEGGVEEPEEAFRFLLPATMFGAVPEGASTESRDNHDALMAANQQLQRQVDILFRVLMDVVRQYPTILAKSTELMEQLGDQLGGGRQHDLQQVLAILEFESNRDQRWMAHDRAKQRAGHRADLLGKSVDVAGPDLMMLLRKAMEMVMTSGHPMTGSGPTTASPQSPSSSSWTTADVGSNTTTDPHATASASTASKTNTTSSTTPTPTAASNTRPPAQSPLARRLDDALQSVSAEGLAEAKAVLDEDEWRLLEAARGAEDDEEFAAIFDKLRELWTAHGEAATAQRMQALVVALGPQATMTLGTLLRQVQG